MIRIHPQTLIYLAKELGRVTTSWEHLNSKEDRADVGLAADLKAFESYRQQFSNLGLRLTDAHLARIIKRLKEPPVTIRELVELQKELANRMYDECCLMHCVSLTPEETAFFDPKAPIFGIDVEDKLPSIGEDISEAGKCLGLRRPTAAVFHLMRVMEVGVQKFGEKLGLTFIDQKVWQIILDGINLEIKKLGKTPDAKLYAGMSAHLFNVKLAWRNEAMHPKATYTVDEAEAIFNAVRAFMRELISLL